MTIQAETRAFALEYVKTIGIVNSGFNDRGFANPYDMAIASDGRLFVLNRCDPARAAAIRVGICNLDEEYLGEFGDGYGSGDTQFIWPVAMAFDGQERLFITDEYNHRVTVFDITGEFLAKWGELGADKGRLNGPSGIAIDSQDNVYVADQYNHRVQKFTSEGGHILAWGEEGDAAGRFNLPWGLAVDSQGDVYVADWRNDRIQKFSSEGEFLASYGESGAGDGQFHRPSSVAVDPEGYIYVADWGNERVQVLNAGGAFELELKGQATLSAWAREYLAVNPEEERERATSDLLPELPPHLNTPHLISSQTEPYFWGPVSVKLDGQNRLYVTETNRHRFQVYEKA